jgi:lactoylglutathione lyase
VNDLEKAVAFYALFGMVVQKTMDFSEWRFSLTFMGFDAKSTLVELTYNYPPEDGTPSKPYETDLSQGFSHFAIAVKDVYATCAAIEAHPELAKIVRPAGPMGVGGPVIAFVQSTTDTVSKIELVEL